MADVTAVDPDVFFASWQAARLARMDLKPMGATGLMQAALVWRHWLAFCTVHGVAWEMARSVDIARFCQAIGPRSSVKKTSPVTRRRYWRVLRDLYAHALARGIVAVNPAEGAQPPATERVPSLALPLPMWTALLEGLYDNFPGGDDFKARRNRLALLLMMRAALTVREIIGLSLDCVQGGADKILDWLCRKSEALSVFEGTEGAKGDFDSPFVIPADVGVNDLNELFNGCGLPVARIKQLRFQPPEEALTGRIVG